MGESVRPRFTFARNNPEDAAMNQIIACRGPARCARGLLVLMAAAVALACGDVSFDLTRPLFPIDTSTGIGLRTLEITGSLTAAHGTCFEATVLYDGVELEGSRIVCSAAEGCSRLDLSAVTDTESGRHTISFQVIRQSRDAIDYRAQLRIRISREGLPFELFLTPDPIRALMVAGEVVTFEVEFTN